MSGEFLEIELTGKCDCRCKHCYGDFPKKGELPKEKVREIIEQTPANYGIIFSGGEPFLRSDLEDLVNDAEDFIVWITTNGHLVSKERIDSLGKNAVLVFGLDGMGSAHDWYRGRRGSYEKVIEALEMTRNRPTEIITTLWKGMVGQINEMIEIAERYNAILHFNHLIPVGRSKNNPEIFLSSTEKELVYERLSRSQSEWMLTDVHKVTEKDLDKGIDLFCKGRFNVAVNGDVRPCEFHGKRFGNLFEERFEDILNRARNTHFFRARENGFKEYVRLDLEDPFDYHTGICYKIPV